jgi:hypothetical protein
MIQGNAWNNALVAANTIGVTKKVVRKPITTYVEHPERVLFCLHLSNPFRKLCIRFAEWKYDHYFLIIQKQ